MKYYSRDEQKEIAINLLSLMGRVYEREQFRVNDAVYLSYTDEDGITSHLTVKDKPEVAAKLKEVEKQFNAVVYYVIGTPTAWGYNYSFLLTSRYREDVELIHPYGNRQFIVWSYVWNVDVEHNSEAGNVGVFSAPGYPIIRIS